MFEFEVVEDGALGDDVFEQRPQVGEHEPWIQEVGAVDLTDRAARVD